MATNTPNLGLELPAGSDYYNISVLNSNSQKIDDEAGDVRLELSNKLDREPPTLITIPLESGYTGSLSCSKDTVGGCVLYISNVEKTSGAFSLGEVFANLPESYRPITTVYESIATGDGTTYGNSRSILASIAVSGDVRLSSAAGFLPGTNLSGSIPYHAAL